MVQQLRKRDSYFDVVKGITILLVVVGHTIQYGNGVSFFQENEFYHNSAFKVIYSFHMPLFMLVSGYFFYFSNKKYRVNELIKSKLQTILIPIVSFSFLYFLLTKFNITDSILLSFRRFAWTLLSVKIYWFLWALLSISIVLKLILSLKNRYLIVGVCLILFAALPLLIDDNFGLYLFFFIYPYFLLGYLANKFNAYAYLKNNRYAVFLVSICCYLVLMLFYTESSFIYTTKLSLFQNGSFSFSQLVIDLYRWGVGFVGCVAILSLISILMQYSVFLVDILSRVGVFSLGIYCFQIILFRIYSLHFMDSLMGGGYFIPGNYMLIDFCHMVGFKD